MSPELESRVEWSPTTAELLLSAVPRPPHSLLPSLPSLPTLPTPPLLLLLLCPSAWNASAVADSRWPTYTAYA